MNSGKAFDWGICGVGVMPFDARMKQIMDEQDCLYTLVLKDPDGTWEPRVIGSIIEDLYAPDDPQAVIEKMADPVTRIVSLTVTEGGYNFHQVTGEFDAENPAVAADLVPGAEPRTTFGLITEALARRRARGLPAFTIMFCDNIQASGTWPIGCSRRSPDCVKQHGATPSPGKRVSPPGWRPMYGSRTRWWTGSPTRTCRAPSAGSDVSVKGPRRAIRPGPRTAPGPR